MGIRGPRGHLQSATGREIRGPEERGPRAGRVPAGKVQEPNAWGLYDMISRGRTK